MKLNEKYEVSPFGNAFDSLFSLLTRGGPFTNEIHPSETIGSTHYGPVRYKDEGTQTRIEFLLPGWKKSDLSLSLEGNQLKLSGKKTKGKEADGLFQANDLNLEVSLPEHLLTEKASAKLEEGVLKVIIPSVKQVAPKSIKIG